MAHNLVGYAREATPAGAGNTPGAMALHLQGGSGVIQRTSRTPPIDFRLACNRRLRVAAFTRDDFTCQDCGWRPQDAEIPVDYDGRYTIGTWPHPIAERVLHMDHVIARAVGGPSVLANMATRCGPCNYRKGGG